jgi:hypothetical protein
MTSENGTYNPEAGLQEANGLRQHETNIETMMASKVTPPEVIERFKRDYPSLALRVRDGNDKCIAAWLRIQDIDDLKVFDLGAEKIEQAQKKLNRLCLQLEAMEEVLEGQGNCLYIMNKKKSRKCKMFERTPGGKMVETFCFVCPSAIAHWRDEWSQFDQAILFSKDGKHPVPGV